MSDQPAIPGVRFIGAATYAHHGPQAAIVTKPLAQDALRAACKVLPPGARQNLLLAKRWGLWAVLATEDWAFANCRRNKAPRHGDDMLEEVAK